MTPTAAIEAMLATANLTQEQAATALGKTGRQAVNRKLRRGCWQVSELAQLAEACGYKLVLESKYSRIEIGR